MHLPRRSLKLALIVGPSVLAAAVRYAMLGCTNLDTTLFLVPWYDYIVEHGGYRALGDAFSNYSAPYTYLLVLATYLRPYVPKLAAIKAISIVFDYVAAFVMYRLVRLRYESGPVPWLAYFAVLFAPTVAINSACWGQSDVIYSTWLLASVYFICVRKPLRSILSFSLALAFKAQAIFLVPFILLLLLKRQVPWRYLTRIPFVYLLLALPAALLGRPLFDLLTIYLQQSLTYEDLSSNAPNLYLLIPNSYFSTVSVLGLLVAVGAGVGIALVALRSRASLERGLLLKAATLSVALMPFLLPKMHDRYFFPADLISIGLAFYFPRFWFIPALFQCTSAIAYAPYLIGRPLLPLPLAGLANTLPVGALLLTYLRTLFPPGTRPTVAAADVRAGPAGTA